MDALQKAREKQRRNIETNEENDLVPWSELVEHESHAWLATAGLMQH